MPTATSLTRHQDMSNRLPFEWLVSRWEMIDHRVAGHALKHAALSTATADNNLDDITSSGCRGCSNSLAASRARMPRAAESSWGRGSQSMARQREYASVES